MSSETKDEAELLRVVGAMDEENSLAVYWAAFETRFRARLAPVRGGEALQITSIAEVEFDDSGGFVFPGEETDLHDCRFNHVPPVVREAVERPVQYPEEVAHA